MDSQLLKAFMPDRWQVLQLELKPFCLGHNITLHALESPFVQDDPPETFTALDLFTAVSVCSFSWEDGRAFVSDLEHVKKQFTKWVAVIPPADIERRSLTFFEYLKAGNIRPDIRIESDAAGGTIYTPWQQRLRVRLMRDLHMTESQVMNRPLVLCWWDYYTLAELDGALTICTDEEKQFVDECLRKADEEWHARQN